MSNEKTTTTERNDVNGCVESLFILQLPTSCHVFIVRGFRYWLILRIAITLLKNSYEKRKENKKYELRDEISVKSFAFFVIWIHKMNVIKEKFDVIYQYLLELVITSAEQNTNSTYVWIKKLYGIYSFVDKKKCIHIE